MTQILVHGDGIKSVYIKMTKIMCVCANEQIRHKEFQEVIKHKYKGRL